MASSNQTPDVLFSPIAANADASDINTIPQTYDPSNYGYAAQNVGFPTECRLPVLNPDGTLGQGRAPRMQDWNGIMKLVSSHNFFLQNGGSYTFNPTVSSNIGGYPKNAILWYFPENEAPCIVYSLINDNTNNFVDDPTLIDGIHWEMLVNPSSYANIALTNSPYTTNRILEIPQDIQLELSNGTLTLKAGSKVYVPNGFEADGITPKFDVVTIENDVSRSLFASVTSSNVLIFYVTTSNTLSYDSTNYGGTSGTTFPTHGWFFKTDSNLLIGVDSSADNGARTAFPLCSATLSNGTITSIDQIFNGFGYIGSILFALPGVKVQTPNGRNADGTYKSVIRTIDSVRTYTAGAWGTRNLNIQISGSFASLYFEAQAVERFTYNKKFSSDTTTYSYDENTGVWWYSTDQSSWVEIPNNIVGFCRVESGKITQFQVGTVDSVANSNASNFSQAGRSEISRLASISKRGIQLTLGASGSQYIMPANGRLCLKVESGGCQIYVNASQHDNKVLYSNSGAGAGSWDSVVAKVTKGDLVTIYYGGSNQWFYLAYDNGEV